MNVLNPASGAVTCTVQLELDVEHRDLDAVIEMLTLDGHHDQLQLRRLKKRKLRLKDEIAVLEDMTVPDIIA